MVADGIGMNISLSESQSSPSGTNSFNIMYYASGVSLSFSSKSLTTKLLDVHPLINEAAAFASVAKLNNNFEKALVLANEQIILLI